MNEHMSQTIRNCYDSHVHLLAIGQVASGLQLGSLTNEADIENIKIKSEDQRGDWIVGFGWDQNKWRKPVFPSKISLDKKFPDRPVFLSRVDGHASWLNSKAMQILEKKGFDFSKDPKGGSISKDTNGQASGLLFDQAHINALLMLPDFSVEQKGAHFKLSQKLLNQAGFTHARDLSMTLQAWEILAQLSEQNQLTICVDSFVTAESLEDLPRVLNEIRLMKESPNRQLRIHGVKLFVDGSLGSKTAFISQPYEGTQSCGMMTWQSDEIKQALRTVWKTQLELAVHTIGDQAIHEVITAARQVSAEGILGRLHIEHAQIVRPETVQLMKPLHITCHMQPCHWLSDHSWLPRALPPDVLKNLFPWESFRKNKIRFDFGSDSPIEPTSLLRNHEALVKSSSHGVPMLNDDWTKYHAHPDSKWTNSWTEFDEAAIRQVYFGGEPLL